MSMYVFPVGCHPHFSQTLEMFKVLNISVLICILFFGSYWARIRVGKCNTKAGTCNGTIFCRASVVQGSGLIEREQVKFQSLFFPSIFAVGRVLVYIFLLPFSFLNFFIIFIYIFIKVTCSTLGTTI